MADAEQGHTAGPVARFAATVFVLGGLIGGFTYLVKAGKSKSKGGSK